MNLNPFCVDIHKLLTYMNFYDSLALSYML